MPKVTLWESGEPCSFPQALRPLGAARYSLALSLQDRPHVAPPGQSPTAQDSDLDLDIGFCHVAAV